MSFSYQELITLVLMSFGGGLAFGILALFARGR